MTLELAEIVLDAGVDIDAVDEGDQTPVDLAETPQVIPGSNGLLATRPGVAELLRQFGAQ